MDDGWVSGLQQPPALRSLTMWGDFWSLEELRAGVVSCDYAQRSPRMSHVTFSGRLIQSSEQLRYCTG